MTDANRIAEIRLAMAALDLRLAEGSDVTVTATCDLGEVKLPGAPNRESASARQTYVVGAGTHPLTIAVRLGSAESPKANGRRWTLTIGPTLFHSGAMSTRAQGLLQAPGHSSGG